MSFAWPVSTALVYRCSKVWPCKWQGQTSHRATCSVPTVNIGLRQQGRERAANILDVPAISQRIVEAVEKGLSREFREALGNVNNPYGDGHAGERIAAALASAPDRDTLLLKRAMPLP